MSHDSFQNLVIQYEKLIFTVCYQLINDYHEAQNLAQDTFLSAYQHIDSCHNNNYRPWLIRIATNKAKDYLKSAYNRKVKLDQTINDMVKEEAPAPDDIYLLHQNELLIKEKIYSLKEPYLQVCTLFFLQEKNVDEIAAILKRPKKTVQSQIYRGRKILQHSLAAIDEGGGAI
ncbi:MAG: RNA polymerase sigma factor [Clostridiales bacterium]